MSDNQACLNWTTYGRSLPKEIGDRSKWTYYKLYKRIKDKYKINYLCTDGYEAYSSFILAKKKHTTTKAENKDKPKQACLILVACRQDEVCHSKAKETSLIESTNFIIRHYLARF